MKIKHFIKEHSVIVYFFIAFTISWGFVVILTGPNNIPINTEKSQELLPFLYVSMLFGPSVAGIFLTGLLDGKTGFRKLMSRLLKWRVNIRWYALALLATPLLAFLLLLALSLLSSEFQLNIFKSDNLASLLLNGIIAGVMVGIFEEIGWTGFIIPRLSQRYSILANGLIVGFLWGAWHFILFWERESFFEALPLLILLGRLFVWLPPFRVLMVWIYSRTESLLLVILTHVSLVFTTTTLVPMTLTGISLLTWILIWGVLLWVVVFAIIVVNRRKLSEQPIDPGNNTN